MSRNTASTSQLTAYGLRVFFSLLFLCLLPLALSQVANAQSAGNLAFDYPDRAALLADGWHFMARTAAGGTRDTEQTSGLIVDYSQSNHPGTVRFPADQGTLWGGVNSTRNSLFRELPSDWTTIRLGIAAFAPAAPYQGACLSAYQDDDNYVILCRDNVGAQVVEWWWENDSSPSVIGSLSNSATTNVWLRLDRNPSTDALTGFVSVDGGGAWTQLLGSVVKVLSNPRLGVVVGGNTSTSSFPAADVTFVEIGTVTDPIPAALVLNPTIISFTAVAGGANPSVQALNIATNDESSVDWTASSNQAWLSVSPVAGTTLSSGTVSVNIAGLAAGTYNETITINAPEASNSPRTVTVSLTVGSPPPAPTPHIDFNYTNRSALLAGGWDFIARTSGGGTRNTEQTSGLVVNYDQATHPGTIRIPADQGTLWGGSNNTRNTLFRDLPSDWTTVRLDIAAFAPTAAYQGACLSAYEDDDNYVILCRDNVGAQTVEWWQETGGSAAVIGSLANNATANVWLRLDRNPSNNTITGFISVDEGANWTQLQGSVVKALTNPRLGIVVGGNGSTTSFPTADLAFVEVGTASVPLPPALGVSASSVSFFAPEGGANPPSKSVNIVNTGTGTLNWTVTANQSWLSVSPVAGAAPSTATVSVNTAGLAQGTFNGTITLNAAGASNSPKTVAVSLTVRPPYAPHVDMNYASRAAFLSDGWWDFLARTADGGTRNTEQTSGLVVDYNQTTHPGTIRIPADQGTLWGSNNNTRNTLFRDLPSDWTTVRLGIVVFAPTAPYQGACLSAYQDDDNYVMLCRDNVGSQVVEWWWETGGSAAGLGSLANNATSNVWLRLDRNPATNALTAFASVDGGVSWAQLPGNVVKSLTNPRLAVVVGGNTSTTSFPTSDLAFVEIGTVATPLPAVLALNPNSLNFLGSNPGPLNFNVTNTQVGTLSWTATVNRSWLSVTPTSGAAPATVTVSVNTVGLAPGSYNGTITVTAPDATNSPQTVAVTLSVPQPVPPALGMSTTSMSFAALAGAANPSPQTLSITNTGAGTLNWNAVVNQPWLSVSPTSGITPSPITVTVNTAALSAGTYNGTISVSAPNVANSPQVVTVTLNVISPNGAGILTVAILVNGSNTQGYNPNSASPGEFQRYPERYLEHLQVPYEIINVETSSPPSNLNQRHLIIAGHRGVTLSQAWRDAIVAAVNAGTGFVNFDWDPQIGSLSHIQTIFGVTSSSVGEFATSIVVPAAVIPGGSSPHYIAGLQRRFVSSPPGDIVYDFHRDENDDIQPVASTILNGAGDTVIVRAGDDPLIIAKSFGSGRAVHFGTLEYLKADRFGFIQGVDDLFWRSLVWAAKKPFIIRGYPTHWAVQIDDQGQGWGFRIRDMYDSSLTEAVNPDGTGGPWKVTGYVVTDNLLAGAPERASVVNDINNGVLQISPHTFGHVSAGNLYWNGTLGSLADQQWLSNVNSLLGWKQGLGGSDTIPKFSRSLIAHWWDVTNNSGYDLWNTLGFRYVTSIQKPGFQLGEWPGGQNRLSARPFWIYEKPPRRLSDEHESLFFAEDYTIGSRSGLPSQTFFLFATQIHDNPQSPRFDIIWPTSGNEAQVGYQVTVEQTVDQIQRYTWRLWSSLAPVQIFTHDLSNYALSSAADRQSVIRQVSLWLNGSSMKHVFMEELGDYIHARNKSKLVTAILSGGEITSTFTGSTATADGALIETELLMFLAEDDGTRVAIGGFTGGSTISFPVLSQ